MTRRGLADFSLEALARRAHVTRLTVYHQFGSKVGLLEAVYDDLAHRGQIAQRLKLAFQHTDTAAGVDGVIDAFTDFWASERAVLRRLRSMAVLDPAFAGVRRRDERRRGAMQAVATRWTTSRGTTRADLGAVVNVLTMLTSFETFDALADTQPDVDAIKARIRKLAWSALE